MGIALKSDSESDSLKSGPAVLASMSFPQCFVNVQNGAEAATLGTRQGRK